MRARIDKQVNDPTVADYCLCSETLLLLQITLFSAAPAGNHNSSHPYIKVQFAQQ